MSKRATLIFLSNDDKSYLKPITQRGTVEAEIYKKIWILLLKSEGMTDQAIASPYLGLSIFRQPLHLSLHEKRDIPCHTYRHTRNYCCIFVLLKTMGSKIDTINLVAEEVE